jgi:4-diphosphocytidyl-2-C-methyl-D-erythritol kinase
MTTTEKAYAKLNLFLGVKPEVIDGRHQLQTVLTEISWHDTLTIEPNGDANADADADCVMAFGGTSVSLELRDPEGVGGDNLASEDNLIFKACGSFMAACAEDGIDSCALSQAGRIHVTLHKRIPVQSGLGGGSSDAAAMLRALAAMSGLDALSPTCLKAARATGADVPFFLYGGCALMDGCGDRLAERLVAPRLHLVLVMPPDGVPTRQAYEVFDAIPVRSADHAPMTSLLLPEGEGRARQGLQGLSDTVLSRKIALLIANNMELAAIKLVPEILTLKNTAEALPGVLRTMMAGSGSAIFGICEREISARRAVKQLRSMGFWAHYATSGFKAS